MRLFIAQTIDGFIAGPDGSLDHLAPFEGNDYGYQEHLRDAGAVVLGRATFDAIYPRHGWTYPAHLPGVVMTSRPLPPGTPPQVRAEADPDAVAAAHPDAFLDGGGATIRAFLTRGHVREARIFTLPLALGRGVRLFPERAAATERWRLLSARAYPCGTVGAVYAVEAG